MPLHVGAVADHEVGVALNGEGIEVQGAGWKGLVDSMG